MRSGISPLTWTISESRALRSRSARSHALRTTFGGKAIAGSWLSPPCGRPHRRKSIERCIQPAPAAPQRESGRDQFERLAWAGGHKQANAGGNPYRMLTQLEGDAFCAVVPHRGFLQLDSERRNARPFRLGLHHKRSTTLAQREQPFAHHGATFLRSFSSSA